VLIVQSAGAHQSVRPRVSLSLRTLCKSAHISCSARWVKVGGHRIYALGTRFTLDGRFRAHAASTGQLKNQGTGRCISSLGTTTDGAPALQEACNGSNNQYWYAQLEPLGGVEVVNGAHGWCLTNAHGAASNGNPQTMWPCPSGGPNYKETYHPSGGSGGSEKFAADSSSYGYNGYCVTSNGDSAIGAPVLEHSCNTSPNQYWLGPIIEVGG
jgi:Ricin-type beta-trefoil lectin domain